MDMDGEREVSFKDAEQLAHENKVMFFEVSAYTGKNVTESLTRLARKSVLALCKNLGIDLNPVFILAQKCSARRSRHEGAGADVARVEKKKLLSSSEDEDELICI
ncbi:hypothetical protein F2P81_025891 [Scophthalmus maximus]|nr:hypothetical protein F2P81_025891 [Scophthalmus maximus]